MQCAFTFILLLGIRITLRWADPLDGSPLGHLWTDLLCVALLTAGFIVAYRRWRRNRKNREQVQQFYKDPKI